MEELLVDYEDYLRQNKLELWTKDHPEAQEVRALTYRSDKSYKTYETYMAHQEKAANAIICLIHQANYLLDRQLQSLEKSFLTDGGYTENLFKKRLKHRSNKSD